jgi:CheY-like chemotaxis protein
VLGSPELAHSHRTAIQEIRRAAERGGALTHQLLAFSRRQPLRPQSVGINELVMQIERLLRRLIGEDIELVILPAASQDVVEADPGRLEQVIMNLVVNARDAMPGGGKLTIETATVELGENFSAKQLGVQPGRYLMLSICHNGVGMDEETQSHVFEPFFTTKGPGHGTGLGLATAYGIIRQSGGAIAIVSQLGEGTTARIYLPLAQQPAHSELQETAVAKAFTGRETILLVEDEARVRKLMCDVLIGRGYNVLEATRGEEAVRLCGLYQGTIDLLVVDVVMPEMSGPSVVKRVSSIRPATRVLYISGYTDEAIVHHGVLESGAAFLPKPFMPEALARKVREVLDSDDGSASG